jgi:hypothetical protein
MHGESRWGFLYLYRIQYHTLRQYDIPVCAKSNWILGKIVSQFPFCPKSTQSLLYATISRKMEQNLMQSDLFFCNPYSITQDRDAFLVCVNKLVETGRLPMRSRYHGLNVTSISLYVQASGVADGPNLLTGGSLAAVVAIKIKRRTS